MKRLMLWLLAAVLAVGLLACQNEKGAAGTGAVKSSPSAAIHKIVLSKLITLEKLSEIFGYEIVQSDDVESEDYELKLRFKDIEASFVSITASSINGADIYDSNRKQTELRVVKDLDGIGDKAFYFEHNNGVKGVRALGNGVYLEVAISLFTFDDSPDSALVKEADLNSEQHAKDVVVELLAAIGK
jgi:hypothetical protein